MSSRASGGTRTENVESHWSGGSDIPDDRVITAVTSVMYCKQEYCHESVL
jgi:hypothetical protein